MFTVLMRLSLVESCVKQGIDKIFQMLQRLVLEIMDILLLVVVKIIVFFPLKFSVI